MVLTTPKCMVVRKKLNSNQYVVQDLNSLMLNFGYNSNERFGTIDAFVISKEDYDSILENSDKDELVKKINAGSPLIVISKEHLGLVSPKVRYVPESNLLDELTELQVSAVEYNPVQAEASVISISNKESVKDVEEINTKKIEEEARVYKEQKTEELEKQQETGKKEIERKQEAEKVERVVSLNTLNMADLVRIAALRDRSITRLQDALEKLTVRLMTAEPSTVNKLIDNYLDIEDDYCVALYNQLKLVLEELIRLFNNDISGKVDSIYDRVRQEIIKNTYGLSYTEMNKLLDEREKLAKELRDTLMYIAANYSNVNNVISEFAANLRKYSFSTSAGFPVDDTDTMNDKRFDIYQKLIDMKVIANNYEQDLTDKIEHGLSLIKTSFDIQDKLNKVADSERLIKTQGVNVDVMLDIGPSTTVLKLLILKNKLLSLFDVTLIDREGKFEKITEFDNNLTYTKEIPEEFDATMNYIIISSDNSLSESVFSKATNVFIPRHDKPEDLDWARAASEYLESTFNCKAATVITPSTTTHQGKNRIVDIEFIDMLCNNSIFEECKYDRRILKTISKMR